MAQFNVPTPKPNAYLDLDNIHGIDNNSLVPSLNHASDMLNIIKKNGLHQIRDSIKQTYRNNSVPLTRAGFSTTYDEQGLIKYIGEFEGEFVSVDRDNGYISRVTQKMYIKISENRNAPFNNDSEVVVSLWPTPLVETADEEYHTWNDGFRNQLYKPAVKVLNYTPYDFDELSDFDFYPEVEFNNTKYVFTPAGILTFEKLQIYYNALLTSELQLSFDLININDKGTVPLTHASLNPDGSSIANALRGPNLLNTLRKVGFYGTESAKEYVLPEKSLNSQAVFAEVLQGDGSLKKITEGNGLSVNRTTGVVTFTAAPGKSPAYGADNVFITYGINKVSDVKEFETTSAVYGKQDSYYLYYTPIVENSVKMLVDGVQYFNFTVDYSTGQITVTWAGGYENAKNVVFQYKTRQSVPGEAYLTLTQHCRNAIVYGYEQAMSIFVAGTINTDTFCAPNDIYDWPDTNYQVLGDESPILGYGRNNGYLLTFKEGDDSCFIRIGMTIDDKIVYPTITTSTNLYITGKPMELKDEILVPTKKGFVSVYYYNNELKHELRSYFCKDLEKATVLDYFEKENLLYVMTRRLIDNSYEYGYFMYVFDLLSKTHVKEGSSPNGARYSNSLSFQYEIYKCKLPVFYRMTNFSPSDNGRIEVLNKEDYMGYNQFGVFRLNYLTEKVDEVYEQIANSWYITRKNIHAFYITPYLDMNAINIAKTIKNIYINTRSRENDYFEIGYINEDGTNEIIDKLYGELNNNFPKLIQVKSKIKKFMNVKLYIKNREKYESGITYGDMTFNRILIEYQTAGKYRGE